MSALQDLWTHFVRAEASRPTHTKVKSFDDKVPWLGPALFILSVLYFAVQVFVSDVRRPTYSWARNTISDLGNTSCSAVSCSPRSGWMNSEFFLLGAVMASGSLLIFQEFKSRPATERLIARIGFWGIGLGGLGAIIVGAFPENTVSVMHILGAGIAIGVGSTGIFLLGVELALPAGFRWPMRIGGPVAVIALIMFAFKLYAGLGAGTIERIAAYPETVWLIAFGLYISRSRYIRARRTEP